MAQRAAECRCRNLRARGNLGEHPKADSARLRVPASAMFASLRRSPLKPPAPALERPSKGLQAKSRCDAGGSRREVDAASGQPPLVYKTGDPQLLAKRTIRPAVGFAQERLNVFLERFAAGSVQCVGDPKQVAAFRARLNDPKHIEVDCFFGSQTDAAARMFQACVGLEPDGKIGEQTWPRLEAFGGAPAPIPQPGGVLPNLPAPQLPQNPPGAVPGPSAPSGFCTPFSSRK